VAVNSFDTDEYWWSTLFADGVDGMDDADGVDGADVMCS
jgi:hypothetical protein